MSRTTMRHRLLLAIPLLAGLGFGQTADSERLMNAFKDKALAEQAMRLRTDERIQMYQTLVSSQPANFHYQNLLAATYIQKVRETTDFSYLDRATKVLDGVLSQDGDNYEALRLRTETELERHDFKRAAASSRRLTKIAPEDSWNWGTLGDASLELGEYDQAAEAYQRMINIKPDLSSYNRAAYFRFLYGDLPGAIDVMKRAIEAGSPSAENVAWCAVELGHLYVKAGKLAEAERAYSAATKAFTNYPPGLAGLGNVARLRGEDERAIGLYTLAYAATPLPDYAAALYGLYRKAGNKEEAKKQLDLVDLADKIGQAANEKANRNLAMIFADHEYRVERALELAQAELAVRGDIYTYDTLAWALFKNGKLAEAETAMTKAMALGTPDPMLYKHAARIADALGKKEDAEKLRKKEQGL